ESEYETGLAAIASVDTLNFVPSIVLALVGLTYYVARFAAGDSVDLVLGVVVALAVAVPVVVVLAWHYRDGAERRLVGLVHPVWAALGRHLPGISVPRREAVRRRVDGFVRSIERVATSRRDLAVAVGWSTLGWLCLCVALYLSLWALTPATDVNAVIVFVAVPVATIASVTPLPGGAGGVEAALVLLLVPTTGVTAATATSAALVFRAAVYWAPTVVGGGAAAWLEARARR
ncbi:lysylphosphatidylglycerol synthase transmembrane domain-containing protein, partial [Halarchaeum acidiphilum]